MGRCSDGSLRSPSRRRCARVSVGLAQALRPAPASGAPAPDTPARGILPLRTPKSDARACGPATHPSARQSRAAHIACCRSAAAPLPPRCPGNARRQPPQPAAWHARFRAWQTGTRTPTTVWGSKGRSPSPGSLRGGAAPRPGAGRSTGPRSPQTNTRRVPDGAPAHDRLRRIRAGCRAARRAAEGAERPRIEQHRREPQQRHNYVPQTP